MVLGDVEENKFRKKYIKKFVNTDHELYQEQIQSMALDADIAQKYVQKFGSFLMLVCIVSLVISCYILGNQKNKMGFHKTRSHRTGDREWQRERKNRRKFQNCVKSV